MIKLLYLLVKSYKCFQFGPVQNCRLAQCLPHDKNINSYRKLLQTKVILVQRMTVTVVFQRVENSGKKEKFIFNMHFGFHFLSFILFWNFFPSYCFKGILTLSLPDDKILGWSKLKALADNNKKKCS